MAFRLPSNQKHRDDYYSGDPAFMQLERGDLDDRAWSAAQAERVRKVRVARDTGVWSELLIEGSKPTKFVMRPMRASLARLLIDRINSGAIGDALGASIAFRASLVSVENLGDFQVAQTEHPQFGTLASEDVVDLLDGIDRRIINELGLEALIRATSLSPKS